VVEEGPSRNLEGLIFNRLQTLRGGGRRRVVDEDDAAITGDDNKDDLPASSSAFVAADPDSEPGPLIHCGKRSWLRTHCLPLEE
jgi:hypothetical protein